MTMLLFFPDWLCHSCRSSYFRPPLSSDFLDHLLPPFLVTDHLAAYNTLLRKWKLSIMRSHIHPTLHLQSLFTNSHSPLLHSRLWINMWEFSLPIPLCSRCYTSFVLSALLYFSLIFNISLSNGLFTDTYEHSQGSLMLLFHNQTLRKDFLHSSPSFLQCPLTS